MGMRSKVTKIDRLFNVKWAFKPLVAIMKIVEGGADQQLELMTCSKKKVLRGVKVDEVEWRCRHMKGKDVHIPPAGYGTCPFCNHGYVDVSAVNVENTKRIKS